jgi:hypothetical protein
VEIPDPRIPLEDVAEPVEEQPEETEALEPEQSEETLAAEEVEQSNSVASVEEADPVKPGKRTKKQVNE